MSGLREVGMAPRRVLIYSAARSPEQQGRQRTAFNRWRALGHRDRIVQLAWSEGAGWRSRSWRLACVGSATLGRWTNVQSAYYS